MIWFIFLLYSSHANNLFAWLEILADASFKNAKNFRVTIYTYKNEIPSVCLCVCPSPVLNQSLTASILFCIGTFTVFLGAFRPGFIVFGYFGPKLRAFIRTKVEKWPKNARNIFRADSFQMIFKWALGVKCLILKWNLLILLIFGGFYGIISENKSQKLPLLDFYQMTFKWLIGVK